MSDPNVPPPPGGGTPPPPPPGGAPPPPPPPGGAPPPPPPGGGYPPAPPPPGGGGGYGGYTPPPAQPYGGGGVPPLDVGSALSYGWAKFQQYAKEFIVLVLVVFLVTIVVSLVAVLAIIPAVGTDSFILGLLGWSIGTFLILACTFIVQAGVFRAGLAVTRGGAPSLSLITESDNLGPYVLTSIVVALGAAVGFLLCIIPGIIFLFFVAYAPLLALDKGYGPGEALTKSFNMVKDNLGQVFLILLVAYAVYYVGAILCYVGLLVTIPVALVMITYSYRALMNEPVTP